MSARCCFSIPWMPGRGGAKAAVLSEVRGTLSCNQPDTIRLGSGWGCGLTRKGQHDPCHPLLIAMQMYHCFWGIWDLLWLTPYTGSTLGEDQQQSQILSNIEPSSGDAQISTTQSIPDSTPSSGEADVETRDMTAMRVVRTNSKGVNWGELYLYSSTRVLKQNTDSGASGWLSR